MADTKVSALTAAGALDGTELVPVVQGGVSEKATVDQIATFVSRAIYSVSTATQGPGFASDTYVAGSGIAIPNGKLKVGTIYRCRFRASKTAAGTAAPTVSVRIGTAGTIADAQRSTLGTFNVQTAAVDTASFDIYAHFRSVGSGTSAVLETVCCLFHALPSTGFANTNSPIIEGTGSGFDSTVSSSIIGVSVNGGASAAWTIQSVQAELINLA
jgi:hypothetical protein